MWVYCTLVKGITLVSPGISERLPEIKTKSAKYVFETLSDSLTPEETASVVLLKYAYAQLKSKEQKDFEHNGIGTSDNVDCYNKWTFYYKGL